MAEVEREIQLGLPSPRRLFTPAVTAIILLLVAGFTVVSYAPGFTMSYLAVSARGVLGGKIWQLVTYPFISSCGLNLIFNGLVVLFIGSSIEREWRTASFVALWLVVSITCAVIWVAVSLIASRNFIGLGTAACVYGLIGTFGLLFRRKRFLALFWTIEAQYLALFLVAIGIVLGIPRPITWIWVAGAGVAYLYIKLQWGVRSGGTRGTGRSAQGRASGFVDVD